MFNNDDVQKFVADYPGKFCIHGAVFETACLAMFQTCQSMAEAERLEESGLFGTERAIRRTRAAVLDIVAGTVRQAVARMDRLTDEGDGTVCPVHRALYRTLDHWIVDWLTRSERMHREAMEMSGRKKELHTERAAVMAECAMMAAACRDCAEQAISQHDFAKQEPESRYVH